MYLHALRYVRVHFFGDRHAKDVLTVARRLDRELGLAEGELPTKQQVLDWLRRQLGRGLSSASIDHYRRVIQSIISHAVRKSIRLPPTRAGFIVTGKN